MSDLVLLLALASWPGWPPAVGRCYLPTDQTAGWKKVALPDDAPALAAPDEVDQFRGSEPALLTESADDAVELEDFSKWGRTSFSVRVDQTRTRWLEITFVEALDGAKVDVLGLRQGRAVALRRSRRQGGAAVSVAWTEPFDRVEVVVSHHLRPRPVVHSVELGTWQAGIWGASRPEPPAAYQAPGFLYFRHPGGRSVVLCNREDAVLRYRRGYWDAAPTLTELKER